MFVFVYFCFQAISIECQNSIGTTMTSLVNCRLHLLFVDSNLVCRLNLWTLALVQTSFIICRLNLLFVDSTLVCRLNLWTLPLVQKSPQVCVDLLQTMWTS